MGTLTALLFATPVFGLSLSIGGLEPGLPMGAPSFQLALPELSAPPASGLFEGVDRGAQRHHGRTTSTDAPPASAAPASAPAPAAVAATAPPPTVASSAADDEAYERDLRRRIDIAKVHRVLGIATWASMGITLLAGGIQYHNLYGELADRAHNPCVTGEGVIFGADQCYGTPWFHAISATVTSVLYFTTFTLSLLMPDPDHADQGPSGAANRMRWHKALRWVHLIGMVAQIVLGIIIANIGDRANNYDTLEALATVHMGVGLVTYGALTAAAALMTF